MRLLLTVSILISSSTFSYGQIVWPQLAYQIEPSVFSSDRSPVEDCFYNGFFYGDATLGDSLYPGNGLFTWYLGKYTITNGWEWSLTLGSFDGEMGFSLSTDGSLLGFAFLNHQAVFGGVPLNNVGNALMVARLDPTNGDILEMEILPFTGMLDYVKHTVLSDNSIVITGTLSGNANFPEIGASPPVEPPQHFMFKYALGEGVVWSTLAPSTSSYTIDLEPAVELPGGDILVQVEVAMYNDQVNPVVIPFLDQMIVFEQAYLPGARFSATVRASTNGEVVWTSSQDVNSTGYLTQSILSLDEGGLPVVIARSVGEVLVDGQLIPEVDNVRLRLGLDGSLSSYQVLDSDLKPLAMLPFDAERDMVLSHHESGPVHVGEYDLPAISGERMIVAELLTDGTYGQVYDFSADNIGGSMHLGKNGSLQLIIEYIGELSLNGVPFDLPSGPLSLVFHFMETCMGVLPGPVISANCPSIDNGSIELQVIGGTAPYDYTWSNGATTADLQNIGPGMYQVVVNDADGCSAEAFAYVAGPVAGSDIDLFPIGNALPFFRPGVQTDLLTVLLNSGCLPANGTLEVELDPLINYISGLTEDDLQAGNTLTLSMGDATYETPQTRLLVLEADPLAQIGDTVCINITASSTLIDPVPENDHTEICYPIVNSYDPNDKQVFPAGSGPQGYVPADTRLTYLIRFQNTGNAPAFNVFIDDTLDMDLDIMDLQVHDSSHPMYLQILEDRVLRFRFDDINLPDSLSDEANSHGYVTYSIPMVPGLSGGTTIENTAYIYFDLNPPVITNTTLTTIELGTGVPHRSVQDQILAWPNPVTDQLFISVPVALHNSELRISDMQGRIIHRSLAAADRQVIDTKQLAAGIYAITVGDAVVRVVK